MTNRPKTLIDRDKVPGIFTTHSHVEADKLLTSITPPLRAYCDGKGGRPTFDAVMSRPLLRFERGQFKNKPTERPLVAAHCYAILTAVGLDALYRSDPFEGLAAWVMNAGEAEMKEYLDNFALELADYSQDDVLEWMIYKVIIEEDVGANNVGTSPSPVIRPPREPKTKIHVSHSPGTFEGGLASPQKALTDRYRRLCAAQKVVVLLMALKVFQPQHGVNRVLYQRTDLGGGLVASNRTGWTQPEPDDLDEWADHLEITDADGALSELPADFVGLLISTIDAVDLFWPTFRKSHRVTWE